MIGFARLLGAIGCAAALASCAAPRPAPEPPPPVRPPPVVRVAPPPPTVRQDTAWVDAALGPGDWSYRAGPPASAAFGPPGQPSFSVRCEARQIVLSRAGAPSGAAMTLRASNGARTLPARAANGATEATFAASDPFLDTLLFSRGRFSVEVPGMPRLIVPAWPEPARVVEDCRS